LTLSSLNLSTSSEISTENKFRFTSFQRAMGHDADFACHFTASTLAAVINFPLWRASAIAQSGFKLEGSNFIIRYYHAAVKPPFKGLAATIAGMAWARGAIFCK
jgi:hypothetical protein